MKCLSKWQKIDEKTEDMHLMEWHKVPVHRQTGDLSSLLFSYESSNDKGNSKPKNVLFVENAFIRRLVLGKEMSPKHRLFRMTFHKGQKVARNDDICPVKIMFLF